jgi:hypothetical protein
LHRCSLSSCRPLPEAATVWSDAHGHQEACHALESKFSFLVSQTRMTQCDLILSSTKFHCQLKLQRFHSVQFAWMIFCATSLFGNVLYAATSSTTQRIVHGTGYD